MSKKQSSKPELKLIRFGTAEGFTMSNIGEVLDEKTFAEFEKWIFGQTVGIDNGLVVIIQKTSKFLTIRSTIS